MTAALAVCRPPCDCTTQTATTWWAFLRDEADATNDPDLRRLVEPAARHADAVTAAYATSNTTIIVPTTVEETATDIQEDYETSVVNDIDITGVTPATPQRNIVVIRTAIEKLP